MAFQYGVAARTARLNALLTAIGSSGTLLVYSGTEPANNAAADPSGLLATIALPSTPATVASGVLTLSGTWATTASATGTAASFRIKDGSGVCHLQGNTTSDLVLNNTSITSGQPVSVTSFTITGGNA